MKSKPKPNNEKFRAAESWLDLEPPMLAQTWDEDDADPTETYADLAGIVRAEEGSW